MFISESQDLYLIGNGFDLYLGLKTSYKDFFKKNLLNEERKEIKRFIKELTENYEESSYKKLEDKILEKIDKIKNYNLFLLYLLFEENNEIEEWNDVERKIFPSITKLCELKNEIIKDIVYLNNRKEIFDEIIKEKAKLTKEKESNKNKFETTKNTKVNKLVEDFLVKGSREIESNICYKIKGLKESVKSGRNFFKLKEKCNILTY